MDAATLGDYTSKCKKFNIKPRHTYLLLELDDGSRLLLQKNPDVQLLPFVVGFDKNKSPEFMKVNYVHHGLTLRNLIDNTRHYMGWTWNFYNIADQNCQDFCVAVLKANNMLDHGGLYTDFLLQQNVRKYMTNYEQNLVDTGSTVSSFGAGLIDMFK